MKTAFTRTDLFSKVASFSGAVAFKRTLDEKATSGIYNAERMKELVGILGEELVMNDDHDPFFLAKKVLDNKCAPELLIPCGTEDFLYQDNLTFKRYLEEIGYDFKFLEWEGAHNWKFWDESLDHLIDFMGV